MYVHVRQNSEGRESLHIVVTLCLSIWEASILSKIGAWLSRLVLCMVLTVAMLYLILTPLQKHFVPDLWHFAVLVPAAYVSPEYQLSSLSYSRWWLGELIGNEITNLGTLI